MANDELKTGTTTIGIVYKDGVVMATEHRATMGNIIAHKDVRKLFKIDDNLGLTVAGLVGDAQLLARYIKAEVELYKLKKGVPMTVNSAATLLSNIMRGGGGSYGFYYVGLIMGGKDAYRRTCLRPRCGRRFHPGRVLLHRLRLIVRLRCTGRSLQKGDVRGGDRRIWPSGRSMPP